MDRATAWTVIFSSVYSIGYHPAARDPTKAAKPLRPDEAAKIADDGLIEWDKRFNRPKVEVPPE